MITKNSQRSLFLSFVFTVFQKLYIYPNYHKNLFCCKKIMFRGYKVCKLTTGILLCGKILSDTCEQF